MKRRLLRCAGKGGARAFSFVHGEKKEGGAVHKICILNSSIFYNIRTNSFSSLSDFLRSLLYDFYQSKNVPNERLLLHD